MKLSFKITDRGAVQVLFRVLFIIAMIYTSLMTAWIGDDALISFRELWNFINGDGLTVNIGTRVQAFTHPTWFFLLSVVIYFTNDVYLTTIIVSLVFAICSIIVLFLLERVVHKSNESLFSPVFLLIFSWAYCDYITSGLENSLTYLLVGILLYFLYKFEKKLSIIYVLLALIVLNRFDFAVLFLPLALVMMPIKNGVFSILKSIWPGLLLISAWLLFSLIYFGSLLPNTYYAKVNAGYPFDEVLERGMYYMLSLRNDLPTLFLLVLGNLLSILSMNRKLVTLAIGQVLYLLYIVYVGGDHMQGRFFSVLVYLSVGQILLSLQYLRFLETKRYDIGIFVILIALLFSGLQKQYPYSVGTEAIARPLVHNVADERAIFYRELGLFSKHRTGWPQVDVESGVKPKKWSSGCGLMGKELLHNSRFYWIDICGLIDPLLSRLPAVYTSHWVIGHHVRKIPTDYGSYAIGKIQELPDSRLYGLLKDVDLVSRGEIFTSERFSAIWRLNSGYEYGFNSDNYTDSSYWIPNSTTDEIYNLQNWNEAIPYRRFGNSIVYESQAPKLTRNIWLRMVFDYSFDLYINDRIVYSMEEPRNEHERGVCYGGGWHANNWLFELDSSIQINKIKIMLTGVSPVYLSGYSFINHLILLDENESIPELSDICKEKLSVLR